MDEATRAAWDALRGRCLDALAECPWAEGTEGHDLFAGYLDNAAERDSLEHYRDDDVPALVAAATANTEAEGCEVPDPPATLAELERQLLEAYRNGNTTEDARNADRYRLAIVGRLHLWTSMILEANGATNERSTP